ncbi:MAG TPA: hypothetical protein VKA09_06220 [Nitrososphaeraceae archaeon]|nr:hypothetical protein [Nitrososphaeraceae archaeon]
MEDRLALIESKFTSLHSNQKSCKGRYSINRQHKLCYHYGNVSLVACPVTVKKDSVFIISNMGQQGENSYSESEGRAQERRQLIETLKAPIIQMGRDLGYEVIENHDLGAGPVHVVWLFKPGSESLPDMRLGFICLTEEFSNSSINEGIARAMLNLIDKLVFVVPTETMTKEVKDATETMPDRSILQLRKYVTVLTPSTLVSKQGIKGARERESAETGGEVI